MAMTAKKIKGILWYGKSYKKPTTKVGTRIMRLVNNNTAIVMNNGYVVKRYKGNNWIYKK